MKLLTDGTVRAEIDSNENAMDVDSDGENVLQLSAIPQLPQLPEFMACFCLKTIMHFKNEIEWIRDR